MSYRAFKDPEGRNWAVWLVLPTSGERRGEKRHMAGASPPAYAGVERRKVPSYRRGYIVPVGFEEGWICFESENGEKRRLVPIPESWESASPEHLLLWCRLAKRVMKSGSNP